MNIYQKLIEIRKEVDTFEKDKAGYNYSYVSGSQVLNKIRFRMDELGVILEPHIFHRESSYQIFEHDTVDKFGKTKHCVDYIVSAPMTYTWINADDPKDKTEVEWSLYGQQDEISKALGSGLTYSERYFLMKYFSVPTDECDPDRSQGTPTKTLKTSKAAAKTPVKAPEDKKNRPAAAANGNQVISSVQAKTLFDLANNDVRLCKEVLMNHGYTQGKEVKLKDYATIYEEIRAKSYENLPIIKIV